MWGSNVLYFFCTKLDEDTFLWVKSVAQNVSYSVLQKNSMKMHFFESNVWICTHLFCTKLDEDTLLWIKYVVQMFCTFFCTKLDEDTLLWVKNVAQNVSYSVLHKARWRCTSLNQVYGFAHICFAVSSMKIRFFESNMWFKMLYTLFCPMLDEEALLWIKCMILHTFVLH